MKTSISLKELIEAGSSLDAFQNLPLRANHAFRVAPTMRKMREIAADYFKLQEKLLEAQGLKSMDIGGGRIHVLPIDDKMDPEDAKKAQERFIVERDKMYEEVIELEVNPILLSAFYKANGKPDMDNTEGWHEFPADDMDALSFLIEDDVNKPIAAKKTGRNKR